MEEKREKIIKITIGTIFFIIAIIIDKITNLNIYINFIIYMIPYLIVSYESIIESIEGLKKKKEIFNESFLMIIASLGAMIIGLFPNTENMFLEGIFVMLFFQVGELFEIIAEGESEKQINALMDIRPDYANLCHNNKSIVVNPKEVKINDLIIIKPGEKVPLDGIIIEGKTSVNTVAITGESIPKELIENDEIYSGYININGLIKVKVTKTFKESTASKIIELVKKATDKKSNSEKFITKFSKIYTPLVLIISLFFACIPSILFGNTITWLTRALTFLVVSCPCALVISVPLAYFGGIGGASKKGILIKGSNYLENISKIDTLVFDKTGTITEGVFDVVAVHPKTISKEELLHIAAHAEENSNHPIAFSIIEHYKKISPLQDDCILKNVKELPGLGIEATFNGKKIYVGNHKLMDNMNIKIEDCDKEGTIIHVSSNQKYYGHIVISDKVKSNIKDVINYLKNNKIDIVMLTGDNNKTAEYIAKKLDINKYYASLMPEDKVNIVESLLKNNKIVSFVGDGINDAPVIARSDIGISIGSIGSDAAIEASDIVLLKDDLSCLIDTFKISKKTNIIAKENIIFSITIKILTLILAGFGLANMWMAIFADVGATILAVLNSIRTLK